VGGFSSRKRKRIENYRMMNKVQDATGYWERKGGFEPEMKKKGKTYSS